MECINKDRIVLNELNIPTIYQKNDIGYEGDNSEAQKLLEKLSYSKSFPKINYYEGDAIYPLIKDIREVDDLTLKSIAIFAMLKESRNVQRPQNIEEILKSNSQDVANMKAALKKAINLLDNDKNISVYDVLKPFALTEDGKRIRPKGCGVVTSMFILSMLRPDLIAFCCEPQWESASHQKDAPIELKSKLKFNALQCSQFDSYVRSLQKTKYGNMNLLQISNILWYQNKGPR